MLAASCLRHDTLRCFQDKENQIYSNSFSSPTKRKWISYIESCILSSCVCCMTGDQYSQCASARSSFSFTQAKTRFSPSVSSFSFLFLFSASFLLYSVPYFPLASIRLLLKPGLACRIRKNLRQKKWRLIIKANVFNCICVSVT